MKKNTSPAKSIDEYLDRLPQKERSALEKLRKTIKSAAPEAEEVISYHMPSFKYNGMLVYFAAFKDHCSFFPGSYAIKEFTKELKAFDTNKGTIRFQTDKPIPTALIKKIVRLRVKENEARQIAKKNNSSSPKKALPAKSTGSDPVNEYMDKLKHPLKPEVDALRSIIKGVDSKIAERIKWNAPSYFYQEDMVTFNLHEPKQVRLVFHHSDIVKIKSTLLEGDYKDRRLVYLNDMKAVKSNKKELERIIRDLMKLIDK